MRIQPLRKVYADVGALQELGRCLHEIDNELSSDRHRRRRLSKGGIDVAEIQSPLVEPDVVEIGEELLRAGGIGNQLHSLLPSLAPLGKSLALFVKWMRVPRDRMPEQETRIRRKPQMKNIAFHMQGYRDLPEDFNKRYDSVWVTPPNDELCDPAMVGKYFQWNIDELILEGR